MSASDGDRARQVIYWRLLMATFGAAGKYSAFEAMAASFAKDVELPEAILDPTMAIDTLVQRYPELREDFENVVSTVTPSDPSKGESEGFEEEGSQPATEQSDVSRWLKEAEAATPEADKSSVARSPDAERTRRALLVSKLLLGTFGPNANTPQVSAAQYQQWSQDLAWLEGAFGYAPGELLGGKRGSPVGSGRGKPLSEDELRRGVAALEGDLVRRMQLREVLKDSALAAKLTPSMALVEQILIDKSNLSGEALANARRLVRSYVDQVAEVMRIKVVKASSGKVERSLPPKRVFRNLDLKKTVWKNLTNWDPKERRLMVDRLFYRRASQKDLPTRMIVVVDQSGSMVDAMVQSTILASIFAGLPRVDVHLFAFDTQIVDLTPWVTDPLEVLLRTNLGGGTLINMALMEAEKKIVEPKNTVVVLISDFYEGGPDQPLFDRIKAIRDSGVHFVPVGALMSGGHVSINPWFATRLKEIGTPILAGKIDKLIKELRYLLR
jgi:Mg-chelatase subunit ChlD